MFYRLGRLLIGVLACAAIAGIASIQHKTVALAYSQPHLAVNKLSVKPLVKKSHPIKQKPKIKAPVLEPLYWRGPVQPYTIATGTVPAVSQVPTTEPVVFLGLDDGWTQTPEALNWLTTHKLPFTLFLENDAIKNNYAYFQQLQAAGMTVEDHTLTHPDMTKLSLQAQENEICGAADIYAATFGERPTLFRPPYGSFNALTANAAAACGMKALVMWHVDVNGGHVLFQDNNTTLLPGDIVLMHFRPEFMADINAFSAEVEKDHLQVARLEDWLQ